MARHKARNIATGMEIATLPATYLSTNVSAEVHLCQGGRLKGALLLVSSWVW